ncbi:MAG: aspartate carbamoyltransferase [Waddliaceae bacterium]|nr:aspartate carbamoyltransferase [Waddliaceae bacterium]
MISIEDLTKEEILHVLDQAEELKRCPNPKLLLGKLMASCFYEPSTRTRLSFEAAMHKLGGSVIGFSDGRNTSDRKGESLHDSIKVIGQYVDAIVIRHPLEGSAQWAAESTNKPVINGGDGSNQHPTQTLLDLFSIRECQGSLEGLSIAMVGDLRYGRTVHSLARACSKFSMRQYFVSPPSLEMPRSVCDDLKHDQVKFSFHRKIEEILDRVDVLYVTRIQEERFPDFSECEDVKGLFRVNNELLKSAKASLKVLHPLPRVDEIATEVDQGPHAYYFEQAENGLYVRQAVLGLLLGALD